MLNLKRGRISNDNRVHRLWQADGSDIPGCHLDHRDFPIEVGLSRDPWLDFRGLCKRQTGPEKETQKRMSAKHLHRSPPGLIEEFCAASLREVLRRKARYNWATRLT